jgi:hypothetical protein
MIDTEIKLDLGLAAAVGATNVEALTQEVLSGAIEPGILNHQQRVLVAAALAALELSRQRLLDVANAMRDDTTFKN